MELRDYIEEAAAKAGSVSALARMLGMNQPDVSNAKAMKKRLPAKAIVEISDYIGADLKAVIAANELVTEKDEEKRNFWSHLLASAPSHSYIRHIKELLLMIPRKGPALGPHPAAC